ncbi:MAG TPA: SCP2 sterol-binding domain-containing protein [Burkholderiales bacterium]
MNAKASSAPAGFRFPAPLAAVVARLPTLPPSLALAAGLNLALGRILPRDSLEPLAGRRVRLRVKDAGIAAQVRYEGGRFWPEAVAGEADVIVSATARDFALLAARKEDPDTLFFSRRLVMEGDTDLGLVVKNTLDAVDWPQLAPTDLLPHRALPLIARLALRREG